jgi:hypothetical protein
MAPVVASAPARLRWRRYWVHRPEPDPALQHRSQVFARVLSSFGFGQGIAHAVSNSDIGFLGGAPRNPDLSAKGRAYSTVRYAEQEYAYTVVVVSNHYCPRCGRYTVEKHSMELRDSRRPAVKIGHVKKCNHCDRESWLFSSQMGRARTMRAMREKSVL